MTREEKIINEAKKYYSDNIQCYDAFLHGTKFADEHPKNVWYDADEEPLLENEEIIYVDNTMHAGICSMFGSTFGTWDNDMCWKDYAKHNRIVKWVYINDFLPKGDKDDFKSIL